MAHRKYLINKNDSVQKFFTERLPGLWDISYPKRLQLLNVQSLEYRRIFQDLMLCYQILHGRCNTTVHTNQGNRSQQKLFSMCLRAEGHKLVKRCPHSLILR